jgi:hypothetical protein
MRIRRLLLILGIVMLTADALAQVSLAPPPGAPDKPAAAPPARLAPAANPKIRPAARKPPAAPAPPPAAAAAPVETSDDPNLDLVFGAYQRGLYKT